MNNSLGFNPDEAYTGQNGEEESFLHKRIKELREQITEMEAEREAERLRESQSWLGRFLGRIEI